MSSSTPLIELRNIHLQYGERPILKGVSFAVNPGEFALLYGGTGTGKSSLCHLLAGLIMPSEGQVLLAGDDMTTFTTSQRRWIRRSMGLMLQKHMLLEDRTILQNVMLPAIVAGDGLREARRRALQALTKCGIDDLAPSDPRALSAGQRQLACLARAVVNRPVVIIADEPLAQLDQTNAMTLLKLFSAFAQAGVTIVMTSYRQSILAGIKEIPLAPFAVQEDI